MSVVYAAPKDARTNAAMVELCVALGYLAPSMEVLDPTWGRGKWWSRWQPDRLVTNDRKPSSAAEYHHDFRSLPFPDASFDAITYDPVYVCKGGRTTSGLKDMDDRFGMDDAPRTPELVQAQYDAGLAEMRRLVRPGGFVLAKCQNYVWSGKLYLGHQKALAAGLALGFDVQDEFVHLSGARPQPPRTRKDGAPVRQHHARRNFSVLVVFEAPKRRKP